MSLPRNRSFDGLIGTVPGVSMTTARAASRSTAPPAPRTCGTWTARTSPASRLGTTAQGAVMELVEEVKVTASGLQRRDSAARWAASSTSSAARAATRTTATSASITTTTPGSWRARPGLPSAGARSTAPRSRSTSTTTTCTGTAVSRVTTTSARRRLHLGGFILKDKLWFFGSFNPRYERTWGDRFFNSDPGPGRTYSFFNKNLGLNGQIKLTAAPMKGCAYRPAWSTTGRTTGAPSPASWARAPRPTPGVRRDTTTELERRLPGRLQRQQQFPGQPPRRLPQMNTIHQQIANRFTTYYFNQENSMFAAAKDDAAFVAGVPSASPAPSTMAGPGRSMIRP